MSHEMLWEFGDVMIDVGVIGSCSYERATPGGVEAPISDTTDPFLSGDQCGIQRWGGGWAFLTHEWQSEGNSLRVMFFNMLYYIKINFWRICSSTIASNPQKHKFLGNLFVSWVRSIFFVLISLLFSCGCCFNKHGLWDIPGLPGRYDWRHGDLGPSWERGLRCLDDRWKIHQPNESMYFLLKMGDFSDVMWIFMGVGVLHLASFEGRLQAVKIAFKEISNTCPKKIKPNMMGLFQTRCNK